MSDLRENINRALDDAFEGCPACDGDGMLLGTLGNRQHYRCRNCGTDFSSRTEPQVTAFKQHLPCVDRHGVPIRLGDVIRFQHCVGPYGQVKQDVTTITQLHYPYGALDGGASVHSSWERHEAVGYHRHGDFEHGHETWVEVIT